MVDMAGKTELVKKASTCVVCLAVGHAAEDCNWKDKDNSVCGLERCTLHHHPSLHGSKDKFMTSVSSLVSSPISPPIEVEPQVTKHSFSNTFSNRREK